MTRRSASGSGPGEAGQPRHARPNEATSNQEQLASTSEPTSSSARSDEARIPAGTLIAQRYRIDRWLGRGGMGTVYHAHDTLKDRPVALKLLHRSLGSETSQAKRFHREAHILGRLRSPHVVAVYDHGRTQDGSLYLAMEYLEGETLQQRLQRLGHLPVAEVLTILVAVLDGLAAVHHAGIIHRDVKPANIFLVQSPDGAWSTKLLDFGVAKLDLAETTALTKAGQLCGTPRFMSPEQVLDRSIDDRSDLFSAGVVLYLALTGAMPYESDTPAQLVYALMQSTPIPLTRRRTQLQAYGDLNRVVLHALERTPEARYQNAAEMAADLRVLLAEQNPSSHTAKWSRDLTSLAVRSAVLMLLGCSVVSLFELATATEVQFAGFAMNGPLVSPIPIGELADQAVIPLRDEIVAIDGRPWRGVHQSRAYLAGLPLGAKVSYQLRRDAREHTVTMRVDRPSWRRLGRAYGMHYLGGLLIILIGAVVAWSRPQLAAARTLLLTTSSIGLAMLTLRNLDFGGPLERVSIPAISYVGVTLAHLALVYPSPWAMLRRHPSLVAVLYGAGVLVTALGTLGQSHPRYTLLWLRSIGLTIFLGTTLLVIRQNRLRKHGATVAIRQSARQMLWAGAPLGLLGCISLLLSVTGALAGSTYALGIAGAVLFAFAIGRQIQRGDLFDLDFAVARLTRGLFRYVLLLGIFTAAAGTIMAGARWQGSSPTVALILAPLIGIAVMSLAYEPLMRRMGSGWRHGESDSAAIIAQFSGVLRSAEDMLDVVDLLFDIIQRRYRPQKLRLLERDGGSYVVRSHDSSTVTRPALVADVLLEPGDLGSDPSQTAERQLSQSELERRVSRLGRLRAHVGLILPMSEDHDAAAQNNQHNTTYYRRILVLGPRGDGHAYSGEDAGLVAALVHLAAARLDAIGERAQPLDLPSDRD